MVRTKRGETLADISRTAPLVMGIFGTLGAPKYSPVGVKCVTPQILKAYFHFF